LWGDACYECCLNSVSRELVVTACSTLGLTGARSGGGRGGDVAHKLDIQTKVGKLICFAEEVSFCNNDSATSFVGTLV